MTRTRRRAALRSGWAVIGAVLLGAPAQAIQLCVQRQAAVSDRRRVLGAFLIALVVAGAPAGAGATSLPRFPEVEEFLLIGTGPANGSSTVTVVPVGQAVNQNNFELGANKAPVPATSDFLDSGGGPGLAGNVPDLPTSGILPVPQGITDDGNVAITDMAGMYNLQDVGVYADQGVQCAPSVSSCDAGTQNSFFNDPNQFPNTFDTGTGTGILINPNDAVQSTRMDAPNFAGVTGDVDFSVLLGELATAASVIPSVLATSVLDLSLDGKINSDTTFNLSAGLNVIDILTGGNDFLVQNSNFVIDGPSGAIAIFRVPNDANMLISQANILVGDSGIGLNKVVFLSVREDAAQHFNFNNTIINGVAFWDLGSFVDPTMNLGGEILINNAQGCTQLIADKITLNDIRFARCAAVVPEPRTGLLVMTGLLGLAGWRRSRAR